MSPADKVTIIDFNPIHFFTCRYGTPLHVLGFTPPPMPVVTDGGTQAQVNNGGTAAHVADDKNGAQHPDGMNNTCEQHGEEGICEATSADRLWDDPT